MGVGFVLFFVVLIFFLKGMVWFCFVFSWATWPFVSLGFGCCHLLFFEWLFLCPSLV